MGLHLLQRSVPLQYTELIPMPDISPMTRVSQYLPATGWYWLRQHSQRPCSGGEQRPRRGRPAIG
eukprot:6206279-Pleurochrysis_carterae.AAC.3